MAYRDYSYGTDSPGRWDRERFERARARSRPRGETLRFEEDDYYRRGPRGEERDVRVEIDESRRRGGRDYHDRYVYDDERFEQPRRRPDFVEPDRYEAAGREVAPYRKPKRPEYHRRPSSLDVYDRRPIPRYDDERDVNVTLNVRAPEVPRYDDRDEDYRDVRIRRERERDTYRRRRSNSSHSSERITISKPKRGKTRMPKRLVHLRTILDLGHPYDEEENFYVVHVALAKEEIDGVLEKSKVYFKESVRVDESRLLEAPASDAVGDGEIIETTTTKIITNPTKADVARIEAEAADRRDDRAIAEETAASIRSPSPGRHGHRGRSSSRPRGEEIFAEREGNSVALVLPHRNKSRSRRDIDQEIRRLEREKERIRERSSRRGRDVPITLDDYEEEEDNRRGGGDEIRLEKDAAGNLRFERDARSRRSFSGRPRPSQRDVKAALFSLT